MDNYDSFVYNIIALIREVSPELAFDVVKNDEVDLETLDRYDAVLLSPGPGVPSEAGLMPQVIEKCEHSSCILGVCLGHQALAEYYGAKLFRLDNPLHGLKDRLDILKADDTLLSRLDESETIGHYHSWCVAKDGFPDCLIATSEDSFGNLMSFSHKTLPIFGLQFHPESYMSSCGEKIIRAWLDFAKLRTENK